MTTTTAIQQQQVINCSDSIKQEAKDEQRVSEELTELISQRSMKQKEDSLGITELREQIEALKHEAKFRMGDKDALKKQSDICLATGFVGGLTLGGVATAVINFLDKRRGGGGGYSGCLFTLLASLLCAGGAIGGLAVGGLASELEYGYYQWQGDKNNQRLNEIQQQIKTFEQEIEKKQKEAGLI